MRLPRLPNGRPDLDAIRQYDDGVRWYQLGAKRFPSVTSVLRCWPTGDVLTRWAVGQVADRWLDDPTLAERLTNDAGRTAARKKLVDLAWDERNKAGRRGIAVHEAVEQRLSQIGTDDVDAFIREKYSDVNLGQVQAMSGQAMRALSEIGGRLVGVELPCFYDAEPKWSYAGTMDVMLDVDADRPLARSLGWGEKRPMRVIADFKTSKGVWPSHAIQVAAYMAAQPYDADGPMEWRADLGLIVHLGLTSWSALPVDPVVGWSAWTATRMLFEQRNQDARLGQVDLSGWPL